MKNRFDSPKDREPEKKLEPSLDKTTIFKGTSYRVETTTNPELQKQKGQKK